jgi:tRNA(Ile)-lysidine synthase
VKRHSDSFASEWLTARLAGLLPGYPRVSLCVAFSGGVDSTALLAALATGSPKSVHLRALHVDHGLRPASKLWARHCRALARRLRVPLKVLATKVERPRGESLEAAAREARYRLLAAALQPGEILLTAHHSDDQLETVLLQLFRGSGLPGIAAMPALAPFARGWLARPLLSRSRAELEAWVREQGLTWVDDDTNSDESLDRNFLRLRVLPLIRERWPGSATAVARSARHAAEAQALLDRLASADVDRASYGESLSVKSLRALPAERRRNALRYWITREGYLAPDTRRLQEIAGPLLDARPDANPFVEWGRGQATRSPADNDRAVPQRAPPRTRAAAEADVEQRPRLGARNTADSDVSDNARLGARVQRDGDLLSLSSASRNFASVAPPSAPHAHQSPAAATSPPLEIVWPWRTSHICELPGGLGKLELEPDPRGPIDLDSLPHPLTIRWRRGGERLSPRPGGPRRPLKSLLQESHVPVAERGRLPLLFSVTSPGPKLLAVANLLTDESVQANPATRRRARLLWKKSSH